MAGRRGDISLINTPSPGSSKCQLLQRLCTSCSSCKHKTPLLCSYRSLLSCRLGVLSGRLAQASAGIVGLSHVSVITITQQSWMFFCVDMVSSSSWILLESDLAFVTKRLGSEGLCGSLLSLARIPARQPRLCFLSLRRLRRF